jgi:hypothetical protein
LNKKSLPVPAHGLLRVKFYGSYPPIALFEMGQIRFFWAGWVSLIGSGGSCLGIGARAGFAVVTSPLA